MHANSSYRGNRPTITQTNKLTNKHTDRADYITLRSLVCSVIIIIIIIIIGKIWREFFTIKMTPVDINTCLLSPYIDLPLCA